MSKTSGEHTRPRVSWPAPSPGSVIARRFVNRVLCCRRALDGFGGGAESNSRGRVCSPELGVSALFVFPFLAQAPPLPEIRDIAPPVEVFPYPPWMVATAGAVVLLVLALIVWLIVRWVRNRPKTPPPTPREVALRQLAEAREEIESSDPHAFSIRVSDILRAYISAQFGLRATRQTSPEFLASVSDSPRFTDDERGLLANFLEKCDLIKFARFDATTAESATLLDQAVRFVEGARS